MRALLLQTLAPLGAVALFLAALVHLGQNAGQTLETRSRYRFAFVEMECVPPAPFKREVFLREVQYEADAPDTFSRLDPATPRRLREIFLRHPWVQSVNRIEVRPSGEVELKLIYRDPVLAVRGPESVLAVDASGILLPRSADTRELPLLRGETTRPLAPGKPWGSAAVAAAARTAALLKADRDRCKVAAMEFAGNELILWTAGGYRIVWGSPPTEEKDREPPFQLKRDRLLTSLEAVGQSLLPVEIDLRPEAGAARRLMVADTGDSSAR